MMAILLVLMVPFLKVDHNVAFDMLGFSEMILHVLIQELNLT